MKPKWLNRFGAIRLPYLILCTTHTEMSKAIISIGGYPPAKEDWPEGQNAITHVYKTEAGHMTCAIGINLDADPDKAIYIAALLVHEAVHVVQYFMEDIGEKQPSKEFQAYCIQHVSQELLFEYQRRLQEKSK